MGLFRDVVVTGLSVANAFAQGAPSNRPPQSVGQEVAPPAAGTRPWRKTARRPRLSPLPVNRTRWLQADIETALHRAGNGDMSLCGQLHRAYQIDGVLQGIHSTRSGGLVRLPKTFHGTPKAVAALKGTEGQPGAFARYFPQAELEQLGTDGTDLGIAVGQFVRCDGDRNPQLVRLDPEFLTYRLSEDRWYYRSLEGLLPITPGDGRWVLHTPRGRFEPWHRGIWRALARAYVSKDAAILYRENYASKLANPARVAVSPQGADESQKQSWWRAVMAWGVNSVFGVTPGYDVKLLESNGRGYEVFADMITSADREFAVVIAGQVVTTDGGAGFQNSNIHKTIRSDLIQGDGNALAETLNTQALPAVVHDLCGPDEEGLVAWDTRPPSDLTASAASLTATAGAIEALTTALAKHHLEPDVPAILAQYGIPVRGDRDGASVPEVGRDLPPEPTPPQLPPTNGSGPPPATDALEEAA
jgi:hypothetical protein